MFVSEEALGPRRNKDYARHLVAYLQAFIAIPSFVRKYPLVIYGILGSQSLGKYAICSLREHKAFPLLCMFMNRFIESNDIAMNKAPLKTSKDSITEVTTYI